MHENPATRLEYTAMDFEWDERKADLNEERHGVDFRRASLVFDGRDVVFRESPRKGEMRWIASTEK